jgi:hypothetical protein
MVLGVVAVSGCSLLPSEFNLSPLYRHRLDETGAVLEIDVLWPIVHYETRADGGGDFRIRPFYRRVSKPALPGFGPLPATPATDRPSTPALATAASASPASLVNIDHQFLWPLGRVRRKPEQTNARLFPLFSYDDRTFIDGRQESDWYCLFPFFWGGADRAAPSAPARRYFGIFPIYLDAPAEFLTYDRFTTVLWPLYTRTEKDGRVGHIALWPLLGYGSAEDATDTHWLRVLPLFNYIARREVYRRYSILWPIINWGTDLLNTDDPLHSFSVFPLFSWQQNKTVHGWSFLWPFFRGHSIEGKQHQLDLLWPLYHSLEDKTGGRQLRQWWLWPFVSRTEARHQKAWSVLWPLIWWREYDDPDGVQTQRWVLPFFRHVHRIWKRAGGPASGDEANGDAADEHRPSEAQARSGEHQDGGEDDYLQLWPLLHIDQKRDGTGEWRFPSPWFYRDGNEVGVSEAYGWMYTLVQGQSRAPDDHAIHATAHLFTTRSRRGRTQTSVPFLFSYEADSHSSTLYLFNLIPIRVGGNR